MVLPRLTDKAWKYCTMVDSNRSHVCCNFCGHTMWGGVSRFKEHLAQKRGDVTPRSLCPPDLTIKMQEHLIELSLERENKQKRKRKMLEDMKGKRVQTHSQIDQEEKALIEQAIKESLHTHKMEKENTKIEIENYEKVRRESIQSYELEQKRHQEGSSSRYHYEIFDETDYDSDLSF